MDEILNKRSEILEPVHHVAEEIADMQERDIVHSIEYTKLDVIAATIVFSHVLANIKANQYIKDNEGKATAQMKQDMFNYGAQIHKIVKDMTGIDLKERK